MNTLFQTITNRDIQGDENKIVHISPSAALKKSSKIIIKDLELIMFIGVFDAEKEQKQKVIVNITLEVAPNENWKNDSIQDVVSYADIIERVRFMAEKAHIHLVETFAEQIVETCFAFSEIIGVVVRVEKPDIIHDARSVGVEISVSR
ncbi:MAG: dihydroneopterin aldolase [Alphaproteobacteria bacterium]|nr:dihydroneopterin aldolase [Alphaproteobacteria bacterium]NCQ87996.1 dihydroneopterin aldolase [Alphaproteobacteria bacterium]NCT05497.1 dihydroneopterin aldolase [Alphaproteobacteria bacterium]